MPTLPQYFNEIDGEYYYSIGDRVYGTLEIKGYRVTYRFNDGTKPYSNTRVFKSDSAAISFGRKFAAYMRQCDKRQSVPTLSNFMGF